MQTPATKTCAVCRKDLNGQKRVKDPQGRYFCHPCWSAKIAKAHHPVLPPPVPKSEQVAEYSVTDAEIPASPRIRLPELQPQPCALPDEDASPPLLLADAEGRKKPKKSLAQISFTPSKRVRQMMVIGVVVLVLLAVGAIWHSISQFNNARDDSLKGIQREVDYHENQSQVWAAKAAQADDPKRSFETFTKTFAENLDRQLSSASFTFKGAENNIKELFRLERDYKFDVQKTDSLISPYLGTWKIALISQRQPLVGGEKSEDWYRYDITCSFALQDGAWHWTVADTTRTDLWSPRHGLEEKNWGKTIHFNFLDASSISADEAQPNEGAVLHLFSNAMPTAVP